MQIIGGILLTLSFYPLFIFLGDFSKLVATMRKWEDEWRENEWSHTEALKNAPINLMAIPKNLSEIYKYFWIWLVFAAAGIIILVF